MDVMDYTKGVHCNRIEKLANSISHDTKPYSDYCNEARSFIVSDSAIRKNYSINYVWAFLSLFIGALLLYFNTYTDPYSSGWWILTIKGSGLIMLCIILIYAELSKTE
jgi:hypothetical protein